MGEKVTRQLIMVFSHIHFHTRWQQSMFVSQGSNVIQWKHSPLACSLVASVHPSLIYWLCIKDQVPLLKGNFIWFCRCVAVQGLIAFLMSGEKKLYEVRAVSFTLNSTKGKCCVYFYFFHKSCVNRSMKHSTL